MKKMNPTSIAKDLDEEISKLLKSVGLMFRIFSRTKSYESISKKTSSDERYGTSKKIQDLIGVRVVLYFNDDIDIARKIISKSYRERSNDVSIDEVSNVEFRALRYNIVYSLNNDHIKVLNLGEKVNLIDTTFELQIRTIFSEGWHEVEHDLRYKCKSDWNDYDLQSRRLNGVYASLETSEWTMIKIFDELAYNHYQNSEWVAMFRQKFRIRFEETIIDDDLLNIFNNKNIAKLFFRLDRNKLIMEMSNRGFGFNYPLTLRNIIYFANLLTVKNKRITKLIPNLMKEEVLGF